jgi:hypothetical protein
MKKKVVNQIESQENYETLCIVLNFSFGFLHLVCFPLKYFIQPYITNLVESIQNQNTSAHYHKKYFVIT